MSNILKYQNPSSPLLVPRDTSNLDFNKFLMTLPDNQRLTPEEDYHTYHYWLLNDQPKNFREAKRKGMYHWDKSDKSYHAQSVAFDENGIGYFMKPKHHPTVKYELDWFNHGLETLEGGEQRPLIGKDREEWEDFRNKYQLDTTGVDYKYVPIQKKGGNIHIKKKNRGKFTEYCGGKVTQECIARGKKSKDPKIRKRATFAANVRRWKHENGGILKYKNPAITLDLPEGSAYGGELEPAVVKPAPLYGVLNTYYPVISKFPLTGHSELQIVDFGWDKPLTISKYGTDYDYNLVTNNCSDATRCAVEKIFGEKINPVLFTTPGDVQDFVAEKTGQKPVKEDVGQTALGFNIPFATAMDLKNQNIDFYIQDYLNKAAKMKKQMKEENPNWNSASFDLSTAQVIQRYKDQKYKFQPFKNKSGGILKAQEGTGNLYAPHPLSPVGIALNQARAMAKGKKDQQHLPPGVKEVVGPDGKKVAIRIEQPLVPLEQSIAEWMPGTGDVAEIGYIANDVKNGNYGTAALAAGLMFIPGNAGKLLSKHRKAVSKTADTVENAVRKANVSEYINTVDDILPERQPLTVQKSPQFWDGTSKSKLSVDEKMGLPKSERNQPIKSNPNAGAVTNVDTYLINRAYAPWEIRDGKFIFKMGEPINVRGLSERAPITFHFTTDTQVKPHSGGDSWANAKTTYLVPYKSVVKHNGMPANIEPMDTWWTAGSTFEFPTQDVKVLTADPKVYRQYKARGIDVEFSPEGRKLVRERKGMSDIVEQWIRSKQDQFGMRPTVDTYRQMERETGLSSNVRPKKKHLFGDYFEETNVPDYHTGPATHSNSWSFPAMANIGLPDDPKYFMSSIARNVALDLSKYKTFTFKDLPALQKLAQTHKQFDIQLPTTYGVKNEYSWDFSGQEELVDKINKILRGEIVVPYEQGGKL